LTKLSITISVLPRNGSDNGLGS